MSTLLSLRFSNSLPQLTLNVFAGARLSAQNSLACSETRGRYSLLRARTSRPSNVSLVRSMRSAQGKVLLFGAILVALIFLFPPWDYFDPDTSGRASAGYHFLLTPPEPKSATEIFAQPRYPHMTRVRLSTIRFILQLLIAVPTWLGLAFVLESR